MRILVEPSAHGMVNVGDAAMMEVAVRRLQGLWPDASIGVITDVPAKLAERCPGAVAVPASGRRIWLEDPYLPAALHGRLPGRAATGLRSAERAIRRRWPAAARTTVRLKRRLKGDGGGELDRFLDWAQSAELTVVSGAGLIADPFAPRARTVLELLGAATRRGGVTAMMGQGVGPVSDPGLRKEMTRVLPLVGLIGLREERFGRPILRSLGVVDERMATTGDDAIELALAAGAAGERAALGFNLRVARYSQLSQARAESLGALFTSVARDLGAQPIPIPISTYFKERDEDVIARALQLTDATPSPAGDPTQVISRIGLCRVVVTGSYHAAVFALAQGIPAVGLVGSDYYAGKFLGLRDQFGPGCHIFRLSDPDSELRAAIQTAWKSAPRVGEELRAAARHQVDAGLAAYGRLRELVAHGPSRYARGAAR